MAHRAIAAIVMVMAKVKSKQKTKATPEEREALGKWARRVSQSVREFEQAAGKTVSEDEVRPWNEMTESDREIYRQGGEAFAANVLPSDQMFLDQLKRVRTEMGEKAFRRKMFCVCIDLFIKDIAPKLEDHLREKAITMVVNLAGMLEVPPDFWPP